MKTGLNQAKATSAVIEFTRKCRKHDFIPIASSVQDLQSFLNQGKDKINFQVGYFYNSKSGRLLDITFGTARQETSFDNIPRILIIQNKEQPPFLNCQSVDVEEKDLYVQKIKQMELRNNLN